MSLPEELGSVLSLSGSYTKHYKDTCKTKKQKSFKMRSNEYFATQNEKVIDKDQRT